MTVHQSSILAFLLAAAMLFCVTSSGMAASVPKKLKKERFAEVVRLEFKKEKLAREQAPSKKTTSSTGSDGKILPEEAKKAFAKLTTGGCSYLSAERLGDSQKALVEVSDDETVCGTFVADLDGSRALKIGPGQYDLAYSADYSYLFVDAGFGSAKTLWDLGKGLKLWELSDKDFFQALGIGNDERLHVEAAFIVPDKGVLIFGLEDPLGRRRIAVSDLRAKKLESLAGQQVMDLGDGHIAVAGVGADGKSFYLKKIPLDGVDEVWAREISVGASDIGWLELGGPIEVVDLGQAQGVLHVAVSSAGGWDALRNGEDADSVRKRMRGKNRTAVYLFGPGGEQKFKVKLPSLGARREIRRMDRSKVELYQDLKGFTVREDSESVESYRFE